MFYVKSDDGFSRPPQPKTGSFHRLRAFRKAVISRCNVAPISAEEFVDRYRGRKRKRYDAALESLGLREVQRRDAFCSSFLKAEKVNFTVKEDPAPRLIQARNARYNVCVGKYSAPAEHPIYHAIDDVFGAPTVAKGLNAVERGKLIASAWTDVPDPVAIFMDASRFDQHISVDALLYEHSVYNGIFGSSELQRLLSWQLVTTGFVRTDDGVLKYKKEGGRTSGDMFTSLGNVLVMCSVMYLFLKEVGGKTRLVNDGDDCVVIVERRKLKYAISIAISFFLDFGLTMKVEGQTDQLEKIEFCQSQPVFDGANYIMVRDPRVCLDKDLLSVKPVHSLTEWKRQCTAIAECGLALAGHMPVLCSFYSMLHQGIKVDRELETGMDYLARGLVGKRRVPTESSRVSFFVAFGITPDEQIALEEHYDTITPEYRSPREREEFNTTDLRIHQALPDLLRQI